MSFDRRNGDNWRGYYLTAYGIAVKHGFSGTEEEWLESLKGETVQLRYNEETETLQWAYEGSDEWTDVLDINDLRSEIVSQTLDEAKAAQAAAEQAKAGAETARGQAEELAGQAADSAGAAAGSADDARDYADAAAKSERSARDYAGKPPKVEGGTWHVWDALGQSYTDTGVKAYTTPRGAYDPETAYTLLDVVGYGGASFLALQDVQGVAPSDDGIHWMALAEKGDQGASFTRLEKTAGTGAPGTTDTYTAYNSEDQAAGTIQVYNGMDGLGSGDFKADGTVPMTGNLQMGSHKITGVADGTDPADGVSKGQMDTAIGGKLDAPEGGTAGQVLTKTAEGFAWADAPKELPTGGTQGQILTVGAEGAPEWENAPDTGVTTFNGRTGAVTPQNGDYTAEQVGAVPTSRTVNGKALSADITLGAEDVGARASSWTPNAEEVGAVPTTRTINSKPLSSDVTLSAGDVGAGLPSNSATVTLSSAGWTGDNAPFSQQVACSIVAADSKVVTVDVDTPGTDSDADTEAINAWALVSQRNPAQGAGTLTFYCYEKPTVNLPVKVGVSG